MIDFRTLPGGSMARYNMGKTLVHELGHYFGLYNTFHGGCDSKGGDYVKDAYPEALPFFGCPQHDKSLAPKSCGRKWYKDPVHNFMDYSDDACMCTFTKEQKKRMRTKA